MATMKMIEPWLYELRHVMKTGEVSVRFYAKFTDWQRQPLTKPLGDNINIARAKLERLRDLNKAKVTVELDEERELREALEQQKKEREQARKGITFRQWAERYFAELVPPDKRASTVHQETLRVKTLSAFFGDVALSDIDLDLILQYRKARAAEVGLATVNLGVSFAVSPKYGRRPRSSRQPAKDQVAQ